MIKSVTKTFNDFHGFCFHFSPGSANHQTIAYGQICYFVFFVCLSMYESNFIEIVDLYPIISRCIQVLHSKLSPTMVESSSNWFIKSSLRHFLPASNCVILLF